MYRAILQINTFNSCTLGKVHSSVGMNENDDGDK